jgi:type I restriction enzyme S subunit
MKTPLNSQWEIPKNWEIVSLNDITSDWRGGAPFEPEDFTTQGFAVLHKGGIQRGGKIVIDAKKKTFTTEKYAQRHQKSVIDKTYMAATLRDLVPSGPSIGLIADLAKSQSEKYILAQGAYGFKIDLNRVKPSYLVWLSNYEPFREYIKRYCVGSTQIHIRTPVFQELKIPLPPLSYQWKIAEVLDRAEELRSKRREAIAQLDTLTQAIFLEMFGDPATNPKGWAVKSVGELASKFSDGPFGSNLKTSHYTEVGIRVIRLQNIGIGEFLDKDKAYISSEHFAKLKKHECHPGDVLIGTLGDPNLRACIQPDWLPLALNKADCVQLRANQEIAHPIYICALLNQPAVERMAQEFILGQTRLRISMGRLRMLKVPLPPLTLQREFARRVETIEKLKAAHCASLSELDALFASLQHRAFRGEL